MRLAVTDLFVVGLGFDVVGAWLLARGLIATPEVIVVRNSSYWNSNPPSAFAAAEDRIDGRFGVAWLVTGFVFQAAGYVLGLTGVHDPTTHSTGRTLTAAALLAGAIVLALGTWRLTRPRLLTTLVIEMSYWRPTRSGEVPTRQDRADPALLGYWGVYLGHPPVEDEDNIAYAKRVFGLRDDDLDFPPAPA